MKIFKLSQVFAVTALFTNPILADELQDAVEAGKAKFVLCGACHGLNGSGQPAPGLQMAASFLESKILKMKPEVTALVMFKGIVKENPAEFMGQIMMPLGASMPDEDVANIITYVRSEFGKVNEVTTTAQVAAWRAKHAATPMPTRAALAALNEAKE